MRLYKKKKDMKVLTLQIDKKCFDAIKSGKQKDEQRAVYNSTVKRYFTVENENEEGEPVVEETEDGLRIRFNSDGIAITDVKAYDAIKFINGRRIDAPKMLVEVLGAEFNSVLNDDGTQFVYEDKGIRVLGLRITYRLGKVIG